MTALVATSRRRGSRGAAIRCGPGSSVGEGDSSHGREELAAAAGRQWAHQLLLHPDHRRCVALKFESAERRDGQSPATPVVSISTAVDQAPRHHSGEDLPTRRLVQRGMVTEGSLVDVGIGVEHEQYDVLDRCQLAADVERPQVRVDLSARDGSSARAPSAGEAERARTATPREGPATDRRRRPPARGRRPPGGGRATVAVAPRTTTRPQPVGRPQNRRPRGALPPAPAG